MPLPTVIDEIDRLFDELVRRPWGTSSRQLQPADVRTVEDGWVINLPLEGWAAEDLQLHADHNVLTITGHRHQASKQRHGTSGWSQTRQEYALHRTIPLPSDADPDRIDAKLENSVLSIHVRRRKP